MSLPRFLVLLGVLVAGPLLAADAPVTAATTTKKTAIILDRGSVSLPKGTRLEVLGVDGDQLLVKFRAARGHLPLADTDYPPGAAPAAKDPGVAPKPASTAAAKPAPAAQVRPPPATPKPAPAPPPALNTSGTGPQPATNYGKAVNKAKQAAEAHQSSHVDPTKDILDDKN